MKFACSVVLATSLFAGCSLAQEAPVLSTSTLTIRLPLPQFRGVINVTRVCLDRGYYVLKILDLSPHLDVETVFGSNARQTFAIRCGSAGVVFFVGAEAQPMRGGGPRVMVDRIKEEFRKLYAGD